MQTFLFYVWENTCFIKTIHNATEDQLRAEHVLPPLMSPTSYEVDVFCPHVVNETLEAQTRQKAQGHSSVSGRACVSVLDKGSKPHVFVPLSFPGGDSSERKEVLM